jgi:DNA invertase Pin-like site-specific DNA recombinase
MQFTMAVRTRKHKKRGHREVFRKTNRGVTYVRVSTEDQVAGTSLDDQDRQCAALFQKEGIELVRGFRDEGASAKTADRARLVEALDFALDKRNRIDVFLVWKVDRLARNTEDHFAIRRLLRNGGIDLRSVTEPIGDDPSSKLFEVMIAGFAEFDNSIRRIRCVNGMRARIRSGIWPFRAPPGYRNRSLARRDIKKIDPDPVDPAVFSILQAALKGFARGAMTQSEMAKHLVEADFEALAGAKPTLQFVDRLLTSYVTFYAGWLRDAFGDEVEFHRGRHEPMITEAEMQAIEAIRAGGPRVALPHARVTSEFPLKGLLRCEACGHTLTAGRSRGRHAFYSYYHCFNRAEAHQRPNFAKHDVESQFEEFLQSLNPRPAVLRALNEAIVTCWSEVQATTAEVARNQATTLADLAARRAKILEMAETGVYDAALARERLTMIDREISEKGVPLPDSDLVSFDPATTTAEAATVIERITREWFQLDSDIRGRFEKIAFPGGISFSKERGFLNRQPSCIFGVNWPDVASDSGKVDLDGFSLNRLVSEFAQIVEIGALLEMPDMRRPTSPMSPASPMRLAA